MKTVFITGATSGIGKELAHQYRALGWRVLFCGRRADRLTQLEKVLDPTGSILAKGFQIDVTKPEEFEQVGEWIDTNGGALDLVIANAGFAVSGRFDSLTNIDYARQFSVNFYGVMNSIRPFLARLRKTRGQIAIIGSGNSYLAIPASSPYCASKFAVRAFSECLRMELAKDGVSVTLVVPGFVKTEIHQVDNHGVYHPENAAEGVPPWLKATAAQAAHATRRGIKRRKPEVWITFHVRVAIILELFLRPFSRWARSKINH